MIQVSVCQKDSIDGSWLERQAVPIAEAQRFKALEKSAIEEPTLAGLFEQVLRSGDGASRAEERKLHVRCFLRWGAGLPG